MQSGRFTDKAKTALMLAEKTASKMHAGYVGTEHVLVGLLKEHTGVAAGVLRENGIEEDKLLEMIKALEDSKTVHMVYHCDNPSVGMSLTKDDSRYKIFTADTGLFITLAF